MYSPLSAEIEDARLRRAVADLTPDNQILQKVVRGAILLATFMPPNGLEGGGERRYEPTVDPNKSVGPVRLGRSEAVPTARECRGDVRGDFKKSTIQD